MRSEHTVEHRPSLGLRSSGDFDVMWREMAQTDQRVWSIAHEPLAGLFTIWEPRCELSEQADFYQVQANVPGMQPEDVRVTCQEGILTVHGEQSMTAARNDTGYRTTYGSRAFTRRFVLAEPVAAEDMVITSAEGTLTIQVPKAMVAALQFEAA